MYGELKEVQLYCLEEYFYLYIFLFYINTLLQLIRSEKKYLTNLAFIYSFVLILITELTVRLTGINLAIRTAFAFMPFILFFLFYSFLVFKFSNESKN